MVVIMFKNNDIILTTNNEKKKILLNNQQLINIKIYTINEFNRLFYFDYNLKTIKYIMDQYNVIYDIAKIYLNNMYYLEDKPYQNSKLQFLLNLKKELINQNLLKINKLFINNLKNRRIFFYNLPETKELLFTKKNLCNITDVEIINNNKITSTKHQIYEIDSIENEVVFVANKICSLIKSGISPSNIYLTNLNDSYRKLIKRIFPMFNLPITLQEQQSIYGTFIVTKFFELYNSDISKTLEEVKNLANSKEAEEIYNQLITAVNKYASFDNYELIYPMLKQDIKAIKIKTKDLENSIHEQNLDYPFREDDYIFIMSFNQGILPVIHKDEEYLTDKDKEELSISYTVDYNINERLTLINKLASLNNVIITYKLKADGEDFNISNINEELNYEIIRNNHIENIYSNLYNKIKLNSLKDEFYKYGTKSSQLYSLNKHYLTLPYNTYQHSFTGINKNDFKEYLNNHLTLSYSSIDKYNRCPFSYYANYILNLNIYEETFFQIIGTLFHKILETFNQNNLSYDELWDKEVNDIEHDFTPKEEFFLKRLKKELAFIIETISEQENFTDLKDELHEERVYTSLSGDMKITFTGVIDKIKYKKENDQTIIAIIDYKTGNPNLSLTSIPYGIDMQLPIYVYLAKNSRKLKNVKIAGFYLQKILNNEITVDNSSSYEQLKKKNLLLQGYSNENVDILSVFDKSYMDSNIIKGMKVKKDYSFYSYTKVLSDEKIDHICDIVETQIKNSAQKISEAEFPIAPRKIGKENKGCALCKFKDLCYTTADDIVELKELTKEDILGGDTNGLD